MFQLLLADVYQEILISLIYRERVIISLSLPSSIYATIDEEKNKKGSCLISQNNRSESFMTKDENDLKTKRLQVRYRNITKLMRVELVKINLKKRM